jgi:hypothetical protein
MNSIKTTELDSADRSRRGKAHQRRGETKSKAIKQKNRRAPRKGVEPPRSQRNESKQHRCLTLLSRSEGASIEDLQQATGWQAHSVRGFLSGTVKRKLGLALVSEKPEGQPRRYRIAQATA